jgi:hypothetical protein
MKHLLTILLVVFLMACNSNVNEPVSSEAKSLKKGMVLESLEYTIHQMPVFGTNDVIYSVSLQTNWNIDFILVDDINIGYSNPFSTYKDSFLIYVKFSNGWIYQGYISYSPPSDPPLDPIGL